MATNTVAAPTVAEVMEALRTVIADPRRYVFTADHVVGALELDTTIDRYEQVLRDATAR